MLLTVQLVWTLSGFQTTLVLLVYQIVPHAWTEQHVLCVMMIFMSTKTTAPVLPMTALTVNTGTRTNINAQLV